VLFKAEKKGNKSGFLLLPKPSIILSARKQQKIQLLAAALSLHLIAATG